MYLYLKPPKRALMCKSLNTWSSALGTMRVRLPSWLVDARPTQTRFSNLPHIALAQLASPGLTRAFSSRRYGRFPKSRRLNVHPKQLNSYQIGIHKKEPAICRSSLIILTWMSSTPAIYQPQTPLKELNKKLCKGPPN